MSTSEEERARQQQEQQQQRRRRQLIERLNQKEEMLIGQERSTRQRAQMTEEELEAAIEWERERSAVRFWWPL